MMKNILYLTCYWMMVACGNSSTISYEAEMELNRKMINNLESRKNELFNFIKWKVYRGEEQMRNDFSLIDTIAQTHTELNDTYLAHCDSLKTQLLYREQPNKSSKSDYKQALYQRYNETAPVYEHILSSEAGHYLQEKQLEAYQYCHQTVMDSLINHVNKLPDTTILQQLVPIYEEKLEALYLWEKATLEDTDWLEKNFQGLTVGEAIMQIDMSIIAMLDAQITVLEILGKCIELQQAELYYANPHDIVFIETKDWAEKNDTVALRMNFLHRTFTGYTTEGDFFIEGETGIIDTPAYSKWGRISYTTPVQLHRDSFVFEVYHKNPLTEEVWRLGEYSIYY